MRYFLSISLAALIAGCGGGNSPVSEPIPAPSVKVTLSKSKAFVGEAVTINWESTNATSCYAKEGLSGELPIAGSATFSLTQGGMYNYTVACTGSDTASATTKLVVPMHVYSTSYENKNLVNTIHTQMLPSSTEGAASQFTGKLLVNERSLTIGDFFQEGEYSAFVHLFRATNLYGLPNVWDAPGVVSFYSRNSEGKWIDRTSELIKDPNDRLSCVHNSYSITADFNNDKRPDVYMACTGVDYDLGLNSLEEINKAYLSNQFIYLSQPDGTYKKVLVPHFIYGHKASAGDINKDGNVDIITVNQGFSEFDPFVLLGRGDGTFIKSTEYLPRDYRLLTQIQNSGLYQVDLIPVEGRLDIIFGSSNKTAWVKGASNGGFDYSTVRVFPHVPLTVTGVSFTNGNNYQQAYDIVYKNNNFYFLTSTAFEGGVDWAIIKFSALDFNYSIIYQFTNFWATYKPYSAQFKPNNDGFFRAYTAACPPNLSENNAGMCGMKVPE